MIITWDSVRTERVGTIHLFRNGNLADSSKWLLFDYKECRLIDGYKDLNNEIIIQLSIC